ncbi:Uncharacterised protein [uncultured archaeon]|nr:Uncharacterised protein [uncultured archaeon]
MKTSYCLAFMHLWIKQKIVKKYWMVYIDIL